MCAFVKITKLISFSAALIASFVGLSGCQPFKYYPSNDDRHELLQENIRIFTFYLDEKNELSIFAKTTDFDPLVVLITPSGKVLINGDYKRANSGFRIRGAESGRWIVAVTSVRSNETGAFTVQASPPVALLPSSAPLEPEIRTLLVATISEFQLSSDDSPILSDSTGAPVGRGATAGRVIVGHGAVGLVGFPGVAFPGVFLAFLLESVVNAAGVGIGIGPAMQSDEIKSSRIFAGPGQYPPIEFNAYGIVAFRTRPSTDDRLRYMGICEAYIASILHETEIDIPKNEQMVTVWPVSTDVMAGKINKIARKRVCNLAVDNYGSKVAIKAIKDAESAGAKLSGDGPFLLAWSPATNKGSSEALVLVSNLSNVQNIRQAKDLFREWVIDIENDPRKWRGGWNIELIRIRIRHWVDNYGEKTLQIFGIDGG